MSINRLVVPLFAVMIISGSLLFLVVATEEVIRFDAKDIRPEVMDTVSAIRKYGSLTSARLHPRGRA